MINPFVKKTKQLLNRLGNYRLHPDDASVGPATMRALEMELSKAELSHPDPLPPLPETADPTPRIENPAYVNAKKYQGKGENDSKFVAWMAGFWSKLGLVGKNWKTIVGASAAWCGLFVFAMNTEVGQKAVKGAAGAKNWATYGVAIDWQKDGIPEGSVMHLNHSGNCKAGSGNHVTFADADCSPADLKKPNAVVPGFGGNQANKVKRSIYSVKEVCEVRWPEEVTKPKPVTVSKDCDGKAIKESTR